MKIRTDYDPKPIPVRNCDWTAVDDDTYEGGMLIGYGTTEQQAIADLLENIEESEAQSCGQI